MECVAMGKIYMHQVMKEIRDAGTNRGGYCGLREAIFWYIILYSANGFSFHNPKQLHSMGNYPEKQCSAVWNVCIEMSILRRVDFGFSAIVWLRENGFLASEHQAAEPPKARSAPLLEQVRPCVRITREDMAHLKENHSDAEISEALDFYSDWKIKNNSRVRNDIEQIDRWVFRAVKDRKEQMKKEIFKEPTLSPEDMKIWKMAVGSK